jgi:hypothetical protein
MAGLQWTVRFWTLQRVILCWVGFEVVCFVVIGSATTVSMRIFMRFLLQNCADALCGSAGVEIGFAPILVQRGWGRGPVPSPKQPRPEPDWFRPWLFLC